jgi:hypothetical protein
MSAVFDWIQSINRITYEINKEGLPFGKVGFVPVRRYTLKKSAI